MKAFVSAACVLAVSMALTGCMQGDPGGEGEFNATCPQWVKGLSTAVFQEGFQNTSFPEQKFDPSRPTGAGLRSFQGRPLDFVELDFHPKPQGSGMRPQAVAVANATLELRAFRSDNNGGIADQLLIQDGRTSEIKDTWTWGPGLHTNFTLKIALAAPNEPPVTDPVVLRWDFIPDTDTRTPSEGVMLYTAYFWYRTCNQDGSEATTE